MATSEAPATSDRRCACCSTILRVYRRMSNALNASRAVSAPTTAQPSPAENRSKVCSVTRWYMAAARTIAIGTVSTGYPPKPRSGSVASGTGATAAYRRAVAYETSGPYTRAVPPR